jgi:hypothetical protein
VCDISVFLGHFSCSKGIPTALQLSDETFGWICETFNVLFSDRLIRKAKRATIVAINHAEI